MSHRVLWIEGDAPTRDRIRRVLEAGGLDVEESATGGDALQRAHERRPDLVLGDTQLPDMAGLEVAARLKSDVVLRQVPFVAVGHDSADHRLALAAGCDAFVAQPIDPSRLVEQLTALLSAREDRPASAPARPPEPPEPLSTARARQRSAFIHDLAHELSTPLTPIAGYLKILLSGRIGAVSPQQQKVLQGMASAVAKLTRIVENLADFATLEAGSAAITLAPVDPDALADEVVEEVRDAIREARLHVEVRRSGGGGPVLADPKKLRQALSNVVQNAVKFSPHGGEVLVEVVRDGPCLRFAVYDQGPGVTPGRQEDVFEPFHHAERRRDEARQPGSGLGLPVARRIAEAHGGRVALESPPHSQPSVRSHHYTGSKFVIEIPAPPATLVPQPPEQASGS